MTEILRSNKDINMKRRSQEVENDDSPTRTRIERTPTNQKIEF